MRAAPDALGLLAEQAPASAGAPAGLRACLRRGPDDSEMELPNGCGSWVVGWQAGDCLLREPGLRSITP